MSNEFPGISEEAENSKEFELPVIETERLRLRGYGQADITPEGLEEALALLHPDYPSFAKHAKSIFRIVTLQGSQSIWTIEQKSDNSTVGFCGMTFDPNLEYKGREIGKNKIDEAKIFYSLNSAYHHQGLAGEAVTGMLAFGFVGLGVERFNAETEIDNEDSKKLLYRLGAHFTGLNERDLFSLVTYPVAAFSIELEDFINYRGAQLSSVTWPGRYLFNNPE